MLAPEFSFWPCIQILFSLATWFYMDFTILLVGIWDRPDQCICMYLGNDFDLPMVSVRTSFLETKCWPLSPLSEDIFYEFFEQVQCPMCPFRSSLTKLSSCFVFHHVVVDPHMLWLFLTCHIQCSYHIHVHIFTLPCSCFHITIFIFIVILDTCHIRHMSYMPY